MHCRRCPPRQWRPGQRTRGTLGAALSLALQIVLLAAASAHAQETASIEENSVKAAYLYKFASYVQWPDAAIAEPGALTIGIAGASALARELADATADRTVDGRPIDVRELDGASELEDLDILFVGHDEAARLTEYLMVVGDKPVLTVTESEGALGRGSIINFTVMAERVRFEISLAAAERSRLRLNARLLAVAERVQRAR